MNPSVSFEYIGSRALLDAELVKKEGIRFHRVFAGKWRRYFSWKNFTDPFLVLTGFFQSLFLIARFRPRVVFSKGGYVSVPVVLAARLLRRPVVVHESDGRLGLANRITARFATKVCVAFPNLAKKNPKFIFTGNPVRAEILHGNAEKGYKITGFKKGLPVVLIWGGSQGAQEINDMIEFAFASFVAHFQVIHITGAGKAIKLHHKNYKAFDYVAEDLQHLYSITDFIVGRAGANSLSEIALLQKPAILIPLSNSDQKHNAAYFGDRGASLVLKEKNRLVDTLLELSKNSHKQAKMKKSLAALSKPEAARNIAEIVLKNVI